MQSLSHLQPLEEDEDCPLTSEDRLDRHHYSPYRLQEPTSPITLRLLCYRKSPVLLEGNEEMSTSSTM